MKSLVRDFSVFIHFTSFFGSLIMIPVRFTIAQDPIYMKHTNEDDHCEKKGTVTLRSDKCNLSDPGQLHSLLILQNSFFSMALSDKK